MTKLITNSLTWRICLWLAAWFSHGPVGRAMRWLGGLWRGSLTYRLLARLLCAPSLVKRSACRRGLSRMNCALHRFGRLVRESFLYRCLSAVRRKGCESRLAGGLFRSGMTSILLFIVAAYAPIDWLLRDIWQVEGLSSIWDEALMLVCLFWVVAQRMLADKPLQSRLNNVDLGVGAYLLCGLVLLLYTVTNLGVNITGFRASMQYLLIFFLVVRLIRDDRDFQMMYDVMILIAAAIALYGIYQFIIGVEIPEHWTDQAEQSVRTRVFSIFSNPNILGGYMVLFAPMAIGRAYASKTVGEKLFFWFCGLCMCGACLFTMSRGAWMALAIAAVLFALIVDRRLFVAILVAAIAACFLPFVRSRIGYLFTADFAESNARGGRAKRWGVAFNYLDEGDAWTGGLGYGIYGGAVAVQNKINPHFEYMYVDNYYVKTLAENGIVGLCGLLTSLTSLLWSGVRACARTAGTPKKALCAGMLAGIVATLAESFFESLWEEPYMMAIFFAVAAMLVYAGFFSEKQQTVDKA